MSLRPYLTSSHARKKNIRQSQQKSSSHNKSKQTSNIKQKQPPSQTMREIKPHNFNSNSECRINLMSKQLMGKDRGPQISATHFSLYDKQNKTHIGQRDDQQRQVASLTKIMTAVVALQLIERYKLDKNLMVRVSRNCASLNGTSAKLPQSAFVRLYDLLYGVMLPSGNDAAYLLAEVFGLLLFYQNIKPQQKQYNDIESIDLSYYDNTATFVNKYIKQMNRKGKQLKMFKSNFANPHGLGNVLNVSTARDIMKLSRYAVQNTEFRKIMSTKQFVCELFAQNFQSRGNRVWRNTNKLIEMDWEGIKTGHTPSAGCCLASLKDGVFIIVLNSSSIQNRFDDTVQIYRWYQTKGILLGNKTKQLSQQNT